MFKSHNAAWNAQSIAYIIIKNVSDLRFYETEEFILKKAAIKQKL